MYDGYSYQTNGNSGTYYCLRCGEVAVYSPVTHSEWHEEKDREYDGG